MRAVCRWAVRSLLADGDRRERPLLDVDEALMRGDHAHELAVPRQRVRVRQPHVCSPTPSAQSAQVIVTMHAGAAAMSQNSAHVSHSGGPRYIIGQHGRHAAGIYDSQGKDASCVTAMLQKPSVGCSQAECAHGMT